MKSTSIPQSQQKGKTPTFRVQTGIRGGLVEHGTKCWFWKIGMKYGVA